MTARINNLTAGDRLMRVAFVTTLLCAIAAIGAAFLELAVAAPMAIGVAGMLVLFVIVSLLRDSDAGLSGTAGPTTTTNPANGLPILPGMHVDVRGNTFGRNEH